MLQLVSTSGGAGVCSGVWDTAPHCSSVENTPRAGAKLTGSTLDAYAHTLTWTHALTQMHIHPQAHSQMHTLLPASTSSG